MLFLTRLSLHHFELMGSFSRPLLTRLGLGLGHWRGTDVTHDSMLGTWQCGLVALRLSSICLSCDDEEGRVRLSTRGNGRGERVSDREERCREGGGHDRTASPGR